MGEPFSLGGDIQQRKVPPSQSGTLINPGLIRGYFTSIIFFKKDVSPAVIL
jgi:hypothetical protein